MDVMQTLPRGTTIEVGIDSHGNQVHRICTPGGSMCRFAEPFHVAITYANQYEEYYGVVPDKEG